jgi:hypothetical protein
MSARPSDVNIQFVEADSSDVMAEEYISASVALKLVTPFSDNKKVLTFISNVNTALEVINLIILYFSILLH